jgi:amidophosphoribosyltransferase
LSDKPKCFCGVFGIYGIENASVYTYYGLLALQHRGQEAAGIATIDDKKHLSIYRDFGLVSDVFSNPSILKDKLKGFNAIGHNRYSTTGASASEKNIQPLYMHYKNGNLAVGHNGNLTNAEIIREKLINEGSIFQTSSDTEVILHLIAKSREADQIGQIKDALRQIEGAYCLVILADDKLYAARDKNGFRPLCIGKINDSFIVTSETCALDINSAEYVRDVEPGELIIIDSKGLRSERIAPDEKEITKKTHCVFEYIYFSRPDSKIFGSNVDKIRRKLGKVLAQNHPVTDADGEKVIVISVPDSSNTIAIGYQRQLEKQNIASRLEIGLIRSHYVGRTFILPDQRNREIGVKIKFNTVKGVLENKTVVLIDDSIVRGTTSKQLIKLVKEANPKAVHLRIASPPIFYPCYYGMDFPSKKELIANKFADIEKIGNYLDVDSLHYLTIDEMLSAMIDHKPDDFCTACFSGAYPVEIHDNFNKLMYDN